MRSRFDTEAIERAKEQLGIELPVVVRLSLYRHDGVAGKHRCDGRKHYITLYFESNSVLWHELVHAAQAEQFAKETGEPVTSFNDLYKKSPGELGAEYLHNQFEIEARAVAKRYADRLLIR